MSRCSDLCPLCYSNRRGRSAFKGHRWYRAGRKPRLESVTEMLQKHQKAAGVQSHLDMASLGTQLQLYPALTEFLFRTTWEEDGTARVPGTVMLFGDGVHLKAMLNDKGQSLVAFATLDASEDILSELDRMVVASATDWRASKNWGSKK